MAKLFEDVLLCYYMNTLITFIIKRPIIVTSLSFNNIYIYMVITIIKIQFNLLNNLTEITKQSDLSFNSFYSLFSNLDPDRLTPGLLKKERYL